MIDEKKINYTYIRADRGRSLYPTLKRFLDLFFAYILLLFIYPVLALIAVLIYATSGGPVIFRQVRVGYRGRHFVCYKFRTMKNNAPKDMPTAEFSDAEKYITRFGGLLRRTSLDELPQLFNVLAGDMSLIGPRPLIPSERTVHKRRGENGVYEVRPGLSGLAQIRGRDMLSDDEKIGMDISYVRNMSFYSDTKIAISTFFKVFSGDDILCTHRFGNKQS